MLKHPYKWLRLTKEEAARKEEKYRKYRCMPHYHCHDGCWRVHFNQYACSIRSKVPELRSILTTFPRVVVDYRILLEDQQRFIP